MLLNNPLSRRPLADALTVFLILQVASSLLYSLIFTVDLVYHVTVVKLNPLQLVLVGTILESTTFLFEVPTGVIADLKSRRLSVIIGYFLVGLAFVIEGSLPLFAAIAAAQVVWGIGYTFTSGATQAWIADEVGDARAAQAFLRGAQAAQVGALVAIPLGIGLGRAKVALPIVLGGLGMMVLGLFLIVAMPERGFVPAPRGERSTLGLMWKTVQDARQLTRRHPVLLTLLGIEAFYGLYSEGFDRLSPAHLLRDFSVAWLQAVNPVVWFGAVRAAEQLLGLLGVLVTRRRLQGRASTALANVQRFNAISIVLGLAAFALTRNFAGAVLSYLCVQMLRSVVTPLQEAWLNTRIDDSRVRATMFSISSQVHSVGEICGGPVVGAIGSSLSVPAALLTSALLLAPALPLYTLATRQGQQSDS